MSVGNKAPAPASFCFPGHSAVRHTESEHAHLGVSPCSWGTPPPCLRPTPAQRAHPQSGRRPERRLKCQVPGVRSRTRETGEQERPGRSRPQRGLTRFRRPLRLAHRAGEQLWRDVPTADQSTRPSTVSHRLPMPEPRVTVLSLLQKPLSEIRVFHGPRQSAAAD